MPSQNKYSSRPEDLPNRVEYFKKRLKELRPNLTVVGEYVNFSGRVKVKDKYGVCDCIVSRLLDGAIPCIRTAVNKQEYFINQAREVHGDTYDYSLVEYINSKTKIKIICRKHGIFEQLASHHLIGQNCKKCTSEFNLGGWYSNTKNLSKLSNMYILEFVGNNEYFFKFGVAININKRIQVLNSKTNYIYNIKIVKVVKNTVDYCGKMEHRFKKKIWKERRTYLPKIKFGGMWECFKSCQQESS